MISEAQQFWESIVGKIKNLIRKETENTMRCERYEVSTAPNGTVMGVKKPYGAKELFLPYSQEVAGATVGTPVLVMWWGSMSNAKVYYYANGYEGNSGHGIPSGGTTGQILGKNSGTDYDAGWITGTHSTMLYNGNKVGALTPIALSDAYTNYDVLVISWITNVDVYTQVVDVASVVSGRNYFTDYAVTIDSVLGTLWSLAYFNFVNSTTIQINGVWANNSNWTLGIFAVRGIKF